MFNANDFQRVVNNVADLTEQLKGADSDGAEEIQLRIDSNIHALQVMGGSIADPELRLRAETLIKSLNSSINFAELEKETTHIRQHGAQARPGLIDDALYKNATQLKDMAVEFKKSLQTDKKILSSVTAGMTKNAAENERNLKAVTENSTGISTSTYLLSGFLMFIVMYFIIKFF
ncbi:hypothetical protein PAPHI01_0263 [Pancytospora philotis]|nr:hypothetical protein PAPHI01_0263 [Pancytospora philotis]